MVLQERIYDIDDVWELACQEDIADKHYELIDGALYQMSPPGGRHGQLATKISRFLDTFADALDLGVVTVETGYHPPNNRYTLLAPDVAFVSRARAPKPFPEKYVPMMPDLAVEILSPNNTRKEIQRKTGIYLRNGTQLVWIVVPGSQSVEACRLTEGDVVKRNIVGPDESLSGEPVLPGFELELSRLFST